MRFQDRFYQLPNGLRGGIFNFLQNSAKSNLTDSFALDRCPDFQAPVHVVGNVDGSPHQCILAYLCICAGPLPCPESVVGVEENGTISFDDQLL
jgi:hypothetical protein